MNTKKQLRAETGPMEFESDWRGIFIRGDNAAFYAMSLREFLQNPSDENPIMKAGVQGLLELLEDSNHFIEREVQEMKAFTECVKEEKEFDMKKDEDQQPCDRDRLGTVCLKCKSGTYQETCLQDDWEGKLHCVSCDHMVRRYVTAPPANNILNGD